MDPNLEKNLAEHRQYLEAIYASVEKTRRYFMWTLILTVVMFVLPLLGLILVVPAFISTYTGALSL